MTPNPRPIVWLASEDWSPLAAQASYHISKILSQERRVLFCNSIGIRRPTTSGSDASKIVRRLVKLFKGLDHPTTNLWVLSPAGLPTSLGPWTATFNQHIVSRQLLMAARSAGIDIGSAVFWVTFPGWGPVVKYLNVARQRYVLHFFDRWESYAGVDSALVMKTRDEMLGNAGAILAAGKALSTELSDHHPAVLHAHHGVDSAIFSQLDSLPIPSELAKISHPIAGFFGTIDSIWLDFELLETAASLNPDITWILVGRRGLISPRDQSSLRRMLAMPNVLDIGPREHSTIPQYGRLFDVGLLPFKRSELARSASPLKLLEYLALGIPVVSTVDQQYGDLGPFVTVAGGEPGAFSNAVRRLALDHSQVERARTTVMQTYNWKNVVDGYLRFIETSGVLINP